jgi:DNA repair exonuclease SbcCD ATPase subunit
MAISFHSIKWKNFLSTGNNFIEIELDKSPTTLIAGSNGSGKSTVLDALAFSLFGRAFRKINKPQLINSINEKDCLVEVLFSVNKTKYLVRRGMKPNIFEIYVNGKPLDQSSHVKDFQEHLEKNILKLNFKSFSQVVVLGSSTFVPFMQLSAADRRFIIEDLLDIQIFSAMNMVLKNHIAEFKSEKENLLHKMDLEKQKLNLTKNHLEELKQNTQSRISEINKQISETQKQIGIIQKEIVKLNKLVESHSKSISDYEKTYQLMKECEDLRLQMGKSLKKVLNEKSFFESTNECPTCSQTLNKELTTRKINEKLQKKEEIEKAISDLDSKLEKLSEKVDAYVNIQKEIAQLQEGIKSKQNLIDGHQRYISKLNKELTTLESTSSDAKSIKKTEKEILEIGKSIEKLIAFEKELIDKKYYLDMAAMLLKDSGIKTKIIRQYLPVINKLVNKYLSELDFFVNFNLDESFVETIKSRHRDIFSYASFSEGQKKRIDLSLLFAWRDIARLKNSANTNLLILDEVFDSAMDAQGIEDFMKLINNLGESVNVFVISPKGDTLYDKFVKVTRFELKSNFSRKVDM